MISDKQILSREVAYKKMQRMAYEILETNIDEKKIVLAGIQKSGLIIAEIILRFLQQVFTGEIEIVEIHINKKQPGEIHLSSTQSFDDQVIVVVDDVTNSGRTLLYAIKPFLEYYPKKIQTLVLVERSYKEFAVSVDFVGMSVATALSERIIVETEGDEVSGAVLES